MYCHGSDTVGSKRDQKRENHRDHEITSMIYSTCHLELNVELQESVHLRHLKRWYCRPCSHKAPVMFVKAVHHSKGQCLHI